MKKGGKNMKINVKKEVKSYMKPYSYRFRCSRKHKKALYDLMASTGEEFLDINPMATIEDLSLIHIWWWSRGCFPVSKHDDNFCVC